MRGRHVYLNEESAEEVLEQSLEYMKQRVAQESRSRAFNDCTKYWKDEVAEILKRGGPSVAQLSQIRQLFNIPYEDVE